VSVSVAIGVQLTCTGYPSGSGNTLVLNADLTLGAVRPGVVAANDTIAQPNALVNQHFPQTAPAPPNLIADEVGLHTPLFTPADSPVSSTLTVTNRGPHAASPTDATFVVPAGYPVQNNGGGTLPNGNVGGLNIFRTPPLAAGATATFTTRLIAPRGFAFGLSTALVVPVATDPNIFNNFALASTFSG